MKIISDRLLCFRSLIFSDQIILLVLIWDLICPRSRSQALDVSHSSGREDEDCTARGARARPRVTLRTATACRRGSWGLWSHTRSWRRSWEDETHGSVVSDLCEVCVIMMTMNTSLMMVTNYLYMFILLFNPHFITCDLLFDTWLIR